MKNITTGKSFGTDLEKLSAQSDESIIIDEDTPYNPHDPQEIEAFFARANVRRPGQRGPGKQPKKFWSQ